MTREELLKNEDVRTFLASLTDEEKERLMRLSTDLNMLATASSSGTADRAKKAIGDQYDAARQRITVDGPFLQSLMSRLGENGYQAVIGSDLISTDARSQVLNIGHKFPSMVSDLNDKIGELATSGHVFMGCGGAGAMMAGGAMFALVSAATLEGAGGMAGIFIGGAVFGAGAVLAAESC